MFGIKSSKNLRFSIVMRVLRTAIPGWIFAARRAAASVARKSSRKSSARNLRWLTLMLVTVSFLSGVLFPFRRNASASSVSGAELHDDNRKTSAEVPSAVSEKGMSPDAGSRSSITAASSSFDKSIQDNTNPTEILQ
ncbi:MAG: hypothetical protein ACREAC_25240, partial [Blastocatellia bacterium]